MATPFRQISSVAALNAEPSQKKQSPKRYCCFKKFVSIPAASLVFECQFCTDLFSMSGWHHPQYSSVVHHLLVPVPSGYHRMVLSSHFQAWTDNILSIIADKYKWLPEFGELEVNPFKMGLSQMQPMHLAPSLWVACEPEII